MSVITPRKRLLFCLVAIVVACCAIEMTAAVVLRLLGPDSGSSTGDSWLANLELDLGGDRSGVSLYRPDPALLWALTPESHHRVPNAVFELKSGLQTWDITINSDGHRGPAYPATGRGPIVVTLGDSCTFGYRVEDDETYPAQLQDYLRRNGKPDASVVNLGVPGYTSFQGRRLLAAFLEDHRPDVVVIAFGANDHEPDTASDIDKAAAVDMRRLRLGYALQHLAVTRLARRLGGSERRAPEAPQATVPRVSAADYRTNLDAIVGMAENAGARVVLLDLVMVAPLFRYAIQQTADEHGLPWIDVRELLRRRLTELESGQAFVEEKLERDQFWRDEVLRHRRVYFDDAYYERIYADAEWPGLLRYFMVEPIHLNRLGNRIVAAEVGSMVSGETEH